MTLKEQLQQDLIASMKAKDEVTTGAIRLIKAAILRLETAGEKKIATDEDVIQIIGKEIKQRKDSIEQFEKGNRPELAEKEKLEMAVLEKYLPAQLSEEEIRTIVKEVITSTGATGKSDLGKVMGALMPRTKGKADGGMVNKIVQELLS
ncbi:MAG: GatB/YqeY domain-containing protein [Candidatus Peregrinibacteria bacterium]|nr:GatB/YqeY domain-containing protein [Candidatus Peregrinibacteria bacterium]